MAGSGYPVPSTTEVIPFYAFPAEVRRIVHTTDEIDKTFPGLLVYPPLARDRTQPGLPLKMGRAGTMTHDYKRHGTTTLFAALNVLGGSVIGRCMPRHRHQESIRFLRTIDAQTPAGLDLHLIVDHYGTHKHPEVVRRLERHPRFHLHFTPTSCSWLNLVERFFAEITRKRLRRGVFRGVTGLEIAIHRYLADHNERAKPFVWTADPAAILEKVRRGETSIGVTTLALPGPVLWPLLEAAADVRGHRA